MRITRRATIKPNKINESAAPIEAENPSDLISRPSAANDGKSSFRGFFERTETRPAIE
jgi:hypothetical protein